MSDTIELSNLEIVPETKLVTGFRDGENIFYGTEFPI